MTRIKICGLSRLQDIEFVNEAKPDYIGFVFAQSKRQVSRKQAEKLREHLDPEILATGVFVDAPISEILEICQEGIIDCVQLHGREDTDYIQKLRLSTKIPVIKAVSMSQRQEAEAIFRIPADYLLLDQGGGGTGRTFDWKQIPKIEKPFFLAGGLSPDNLKRAIEQVRPFGVDLSSGVETDGAKDREKIIQAVRSVRK